MEEYYINFEVPLPKNKKAAEYKNLIRECLKNIRAHLKKPN